MRDIIITNNDTVKTMFEERCDIIFLNGGFSDVLTKVRDLVHQGHRLLSHPLAGSVKPNENPFKSILLSGSAGRLNFDSLRIIENGIKTTQAFSPRTGDLPLDVVADFKLIDCSLVTSAFSNKTN